MRCGNVIEIQYAQTNRIFNPAKASQQRLFKLPGYRKPSAVQSESSQIRFKQAIECGPRYVIQPTGNSEINREESNKLKF